MLPSQAATPIVRAGAVQLDASQDKALGASPLADGSIDAGPPSSSFTESPNLSPKRMGLLEDTDCPEIEGLRTISADEPTPLISTRRDKPLTTFEPYVPTEEEAEEPIGSCDEIVDTSTPPCVPTRRTVSAPDELAVHATMSPRLKVLSEPRARGKKVEKPILRSIVASSHKLEDYGAYSPYKPVRKPIKSVPADPEESILIESKLQPFFDLLSVPKETPPPVTGFLQKRNPWGDVPQKADLVVSSGRTYHSPGEKPTGKRAVLQQKRMAELATPRNPRSPKGPSATSDESTAEISRPQASLKTAQRTMRQRRKEAKKRWAAIQKRKEALLRQTTEIQKRAEAERSAESRRMSEDKRRARLESIAESLHRVKKEHAETVRQEEALLHEREMLFGRPGRSHTGLPSCEWRSSKRKTKRNEIAEEKKRLVELQRKLDSVARDTLSQLHYTTVAAQTALSHPLTAGPAIAERLTKSYTQEQLLATSDEVVLDSQSFVESSSVPPISKPVSVTPKRRLSSRRALRKSKDLRSETAEAFVRLSQPSPRSDLKEFDVSEEEIWQDIRTRTQRAAMLGRPPRCALTTSKVRGETPRQIIERKQLAFAEACPASPLYRKSSTQAAPRKQLVLRPTSSVTPVAESKVARIWRETHQPHVDEFPRCGEEFQLMPPGAPVITEVKEPLSLAQELDSVFETFVGDSTPAVPEDEATHPESTQDRPSQESASFMLQDPFANPNLLLDQL